MMEKHTIIITEITIIILNVKNCNNVSKNHRINKEIRKIIKIRSGLRRYDDKLEKVNIRKSGIRLDKWICSETVSRQSCFWKRPTFNSSFAGSVQLTPKDLLARCRLTKEHVEKKQQFLLAEIGDRHAGESRFCGVSLKISASP